MSDLVNWSTVPVIITGEPSAEGLETLRQALEEFSFRKFQEVQRTAEAVAVETVEMEVEK